MQTRRYWIQATSVWSASFHTADTTGWKFSQDANTNSMLNALIGMVQKFEKLFFSNSSLDGISIAISYWLSTDGCFILERHARSTGTQWLIRPATDAGARDPRATVLHDNNSHSSNRHRNRRRKEGGCKLKVWSMKEDSCYSAIE